MKLLKAIKLVNWHYYSNQSFPFIGSSLITGESGAGKSTLLDAIQYGLIGDARLCKFNISAQDGKDSKRNLTTYLRCKTGTESKDGGVSYIRNTDFTSYIIFEFWDNKKSKSFLVGCGVDYYITTDDYDPLFFKLENYSLDQFVLFEGKRPLSAHSEFKAKIKELKGDLFSTAELYRSHLKTKFGHLPDRFFTLLVKGMSFQPLDDFHKFVSEFILDSQPVDLGIMRENLQHYRNFELLATQTEEKISALHQIASVDEERQQVEEWITVQDYLILRAQLEESIDKMQDLKRERDYATEEAQNTRLDISIQEELKTELVTEQHKVMIELAQDSDAILEKEINQEIERLSSDLSNTIEQAKKLSKDTQNEVQNISLALNDLEGISKEFSIDTVYEHSLIARESFTILRPLIETDLSSPIAREQVVRLAAASEHIADSVASQRHRLRSEQVSLQNELDRLTAEIDQLEKRKMVYPSFVSTLRRFVHSETGQRTDILCELLEIQNEKWQNAIEGYLHTQKFHLVVELNAFDQALSIYEKRKKEAGLHTVGIINGAATLRENNGFLEGSLAEEIITQDPIARAFINRILGRVMKCESEQDLKKHRISITPTCMRYQNHVVSQLHPDQYKEWYVGSRAIAKQLEYKKVRKNEVVQRLQILTNLDTLFEGIYKKLKDKETRYSYWLIEWENICRIPDLKTQIENKHKDLAAIDLSRVEKLREKQVELLANINISDQYIGNLRETAAKRESDAKHNDDLYRQQKQMTSVFENQLLLFSEQRPEAAQIGHTRYNDERQRRGNLDIIKNFELNRETNKTRVINLKKRLDDLRFEYNSLYQFGADHRAESNIKYKNELIKLEESELPEYREKIISAKENAEKEFKAHFLYKLQEQMRIAQNQLQLLSDVLKCYKFGHDTYRFISNPSPTFKDFYLMLTDPLTLEGPSLFSGLFHDKYEETLNRFFASITEGDEIQQAKNIELFTDYRTYLDFDMRIYHDTGETTLFSKVLKEKSGGETQTPFYVAIAAAFLQVYRPGNDDTIRLMILDEAFSKMDDQRTENAIKYINQVGLQVIIAAPISQAQVIVPQVRSSFVLLREGEFPIVMDAHQLLEEASLSEVASTKELDR
ncbi:ATP-binding protein [Brevibacillus antibioticus]|uniref:ATP-binding protein n=1 Tax=Brevibacillus antibioticus TaxID=2570228 RepID=UPI00138FE28C|nr:SbcC/MukB-like Walker B domain-containing protein [Brevibacillus antibioticus]